MSRQVIVLRESVSDANALDQLDSVTQAEEVKSALLELGYKATIVPFSPDLSDLKSEITKLEPEFIFNLVDAEWPIVHLAPDYLEYLKVPFTGCSSDAIYITTQKVLAKKLLKSANIPTPTCFCPTDPFFATLNGLTGKKVIIKPYSFDASLCIDQDAVMHAESSAKLMEILSSRSKKYSTAFFVEEFISGREFNVSMIGSRENCVVLHPAEILFLNYPENKHKILDYSAKWRETSFEYENTIRTFDFSVKDEPLLQRLQEIARQCWDVFGLNGYARLDIRVNENSEPFVLEVNTNPNISKVGGFVAACKKNGWSYPEMIKQIATHLNKPY